jgi:membrane protein implicated in regulation of membrane protease activity
MPLRDLLRTPLGVVVLAYGIVVLGMSVAAFLLNVPWWLVLLGVLVASALGFWLITRKEPPPVTDRGQIDGSSVGG